MISYLLKPNQEFEDVANKIGGINIIVEGKAVLGLITDEHKFPETKKNLETYLINVKKKTIKIGMGQELQKEITDYLNRSWDITKIKLAENISKYIVRKT